MLENKVNKMKAASKRLNNNFSKVIGNLKTHLKQLSEDIEQLNDLYNKDIKWFKEEYGFDFINMPPALENASGKGYV